MHDRPYQLTTVTVGDEPAAWERAGFSMQGDKTRVGSTTIVCAPDAGRGIVAVAIAGLDSPIDGLPIRADAADGAVPGDDGAASRSSPPHRNHVVGFDHLVAMSPDIDRTSAALIAAGLDKRRTREFTVGDETRRQDFFWMGDVILELVGVTAVTGMLQGGPTGSEPRDAEPSPPASFWGLALECDDLDAAAAELGDALGRIKDAVQTGRRIATIRTRDIGISVPIALMSPHIAD